MSAPDVQQVKEALLEAGIEIYRTEADVIHVAERVRLHIMDSGVRVHVRDAVTVSFTARSQRSDFPHAPPEELFHKVREAIGSPAEARGYAEAGAHTVEVKDPVDQSRILDVWHEVTYGKATTDVEDAIEEVRWALDVEKYVTA